MQPIKKTLAVTVLSLCIHFLSFAQSAHYDVLDTMPKCPFLHCYNWDGVGVFHEEGTILSTLVVLGRSVDSIWYPQRVNISEKALYQHSDSVIHAIGIACGSEVTVASGYQFFLGLYDSNMVLLRELHPFSMMTWDPDIDMPPNVFYHVIVPGKPVHPVWGPYIELQFQFFDEPIDISGDFYISEGDRQPYFTPGLHESLVLFENHNPPYHFGDTPIKIYLEDSKTWVDDTLRGELPLLFLIVEPECHPLDSIRVTTDSLGHVTVEWDSIPWQQQWVLRLESSSGTRYDTVETYRHTYYNLDTNAHYELSILSQCYLPGGRHNLSSWSDPVSIGFGSAAITETENSQLQVDIFPNPASSDVTVRVGQPSTLTVIDMSGHEVISPTPIHSSLIIPHSSLSSGVYFLRAHTSSGVVMKKLLVK